MDLGGQGRECEDDFGVRSDLVESLKEARSRVGDTRVIEWRG